MKLHNRPQVQPAEILVGLKVRELRCQRNLSLRALSEISGLNINTLSMVENGKCSPSVGTLQQLSQALEVPIGAFFNVDEPTSNIVFTQRKNRLRVEINQTNMENLGKGLNGSVVQPFVVNVQPGGGSGGQLITHTGHEFVYCLHGQISYQVEGQAYLLEEGDSLLFEAHLPHAWKNTTDQAVEILFVFYPTDRREAPGGRHFSVQG